jgi:hypothetical protein
MKRIVGWLLLGLALLTIGVGVGLGIAWGLLPVRMINTTPSTLRQADKDRYRVLIAENFLLTGDTIRTNARLDLLDNNAALAITDQIDRKAWVNDAEKLSLIALLGVFEPSPLSQTQNPSSQPAPMLTSTSISIEVPSLTPGLVPVINTEKTQKPLTTTSPYSFQVISRTPVCDGDQGLPMLQINVVSSSGKPVNGIVLIVNSAKGSERIITGLKSVAGSADFRLFPDQIYTLTIEKESGFSETIIIAQCTSMDGRSFAGGWELQIQY